MVPSISRNSERQMSDLNRLYTNLFPENGLLETMEQIRRFELLRLAFFVLKLRKLRQRIDCGHKENDELEFRRSLMRHAIFQQVLTLISLDAREQALQIIEACRK